MFSAFIGGFVGFMGMYTAYKVVTSGAVGAVAQAIKKGWEEGVREAEEAREGHGEER
jgi:hypothetical protein